jgi:hypothetical protein
MNRPAAVPVDRYEPDRLRGSQADGATDIAASPEYRQARPDRFGRGAGGRSSRGWAARAVERVVVFPERLASFTTAPRPDRRCLVDRTIRRNVNILLLAGPDRCNTQLLSASSQRSPPEIMINIEVLIAVKCRSTNVTFGHA